MVGHVKYKIGRNVKYLRVEFTLFTAELALKSRREIADYIQAGKDDRARIRVSKKYSKMSCTCFVEINTGCSICCVVLCPCIFYWVKILFWWSFTQTFWTSWRKRETIQTNKYTGNFKVRDHFPTVWIKKSDWSPDNESPYWLYHGFWC